MEVLVINSGSSSIKFEVFTMDPVRSVMRGAVERIGSEHSSVWYERADGAASGGAPAAGEGAGERQSTTATAHDHRQALEVALNMLRRESLCCSTESFAAVGHRVVHGGDRFTEPVVIDDEVLASIREMEILSPVHTKANVAGIEGARHEIPDVPHVAVFDTTFHQGMPPRAREYAIPRDLARRYGIHRYGFHGISHGYVAERTAELLGRPLAELNVITVHLGNGASMTAIEGGRTIDTSMGMTPLEGLVMGTRSGDVDPAIPTLLGEITGVSREEVNAMLNFGSGMKGLTGESDMREVHRLADDGDEDARVALDIYCYRAKKYLGAYYAALGRVDAIAFTGGVGENDADVRRRICSGLERLGIAIDDAANAAAGVVEPSAAAGVAGERTTPGALPGERTINAPGSEVAVFVIPTDEESQIAHAAYECALRARQPVAV